MPLKMANKSKTEIIMSKKVTFKNNGKLQLIEQYYDLKFPKELDPYIFDPSKFAQTKW